MKVKNIDTVNEVSFHVQGTRYDLLPGAIQSFNDNLQNEVEGEVAKQPTLLSIISDNDAERVALTPFVSAEQTGTGASQNIAHGLGVIPSKVLISMTDNSGTVAKAFTVVEGSHDATNVKVTVILSGKFKVIAWA